MSEELENINWKQDSSWTDTIMDIIHKKTEVDADFDGKYILPIHVYPELMPICSYTCLQYLHIN